MARPKAVLTTGEIARICNVAPRTVSKWFDTGQLRGYRIPGSRDRRVPVEQLIRFMQAHDIPLDGLETGITRILIAASDAEFAERLKAALSQEVRYDVKTAGNVFEAGFVAAWFKPAILFIDVEMPGFAASDLFRAVRDHVQMSARHIIAITGPLGDPQRQSLRDQGFHACLVKPFEASRVTGLVEELTRPER